MSREIKVKPSIMSTTNTEDNEWIGTPEGQFFVGFDLPIADLEAFRLGQEITITVPEATK